MNTYLFYVQFIFGEDMLTLSHGSKHGCAATFPHGCEQC